MGLRLPSLPRTRSTTPEVPSFDLDKAISNTLERPELGLYPSYEEGVRKGATADAARFAVLAESSASARRRQEGLTGYVDATRRRTIVAATAFLASCAAMYFLLS